MIALAVASAACTGTGGGAGAQGEQAAGTSAEVAVTLSDFAIDPEMLQAPADQPLTFAVENAGEAPHTFGVVVGTDTYETPLIDPGSSSTLEVPALEAGTYDTLCTVPGHRDLGMAGMLHVGTATASGAEDPAASHANMTAEEMASGHEQGVKDFVAQLEDGPNTEGVGNQPLEPVMDGDVKVFEITVTEVQWEVAPGQLVDAMAFNGQIPGPEIRVNPGDRVRFDVQNQMSQPFVLHFHGLTVPNSEDGVPYVTQPPIMPGEYWIYEFPIVDPPGMYVYHSHFNSTEQVGKGLFGALFVEPKAGLRYLGHEPDVQATIFLADGPLGYTLNAKSFPATLPVMADRGDWVLLNVANDGAMIHPMHLHGYHFLVVAQDGARIEDPMFVDTLAIAPGQRFQLLVKADLPGVWAYHCHILPHVEGPEGMFGMVTALIVA
jgi:uncharacterized cupredoxin-like copper-binding protein